MGRRTSRPSESDCNVPPASANAGPRRTERQRNVSASGIWRRRTAGRSPAATRSASPAGTKAMMQPPKPPPVIRAPSAPASLAASTARSTVGTVMAKSSRIEAWDASNSGANSANRPATRSSAASRTRASSVTTCRTRRCISSSGRAARAASRSVMSRNAGTPSSGAASSQLARRAAYSLSTSACGCSCPGRGVRVPLRPVHRHLPELEAAAVEEQRVALDAERGRGLIHQPGRRADELVLATAGQLGPIQRFDQQIVEVGQVANVAHSSAADDDRPAPIGTSELSTRSAPAISWPPRRSTHTTPAT